MALPAFEFWMIHAVLSVVIGALAWGVGVTGQSVLRLSAAAKGYWLAIWLAAVLPTGLALALELLPITKGLAAPVALPLPMALDLGHADTGGAVDPHSEQGGGSIGMVIGVLYLCGVVVAALRMAVGTLRVRSVVRTARLAAREDWPGEATRREAALLAVKGVEIRITSRRVTPFACGLLRPVVVLPQDAMDSFTDCALRLVVRHEAAHLDQRDPARATLMALIGAMLWFDPFVRLISARVQLAAELHCDAWALADDPQSRRVMAKAYLDTLRMAAGGMRNLPVASLADRGPAAHRQRLLHMLDGDGGARFSKGWRIAAMITAIVSISAVGGLQFTLASPQEAVALSSARSPHVASTAGPTRFSRPVLDGRISSPFGETGGVRRSPHRGTDFKAPIGTAVLAPADGIVVVASDHYVGGERYGTVVVLDHGGGWQSLYAHLSRIDVAVGDRVRVRQPIARTGRSGEVTGPHLHVEVLRDGKPVDLETLL